MIETDSLKKIWIHIISDNMDLKRKLGLGSDSRQSYELIRSTQSLVDRLNLDTEDITIQPVHPSIMGQVGSILI